MKLAKTLLCGVSVLSLAVGSAFAGEFPGDSSVDPRVEMGAPSASELAPFETRSDGSVTPIEQSQSMDEDVSYWTLEPVEIAYVEAYDIDSDRDGEADGQLLLEQSDTFAVMTPMESSSGQDLETSSGG